MVRWEPGAAARLRAAALDLYLERGFDQTTVAEIADRAGVTARTFFRHFPDKREVLFAGSEVLQDKMIGALEAAPPAAPALRAVTAAVLAATTVLVDRDLSRRRESVILRTPELRERELVKMESLARAMAAGLRVRGVPDPDAMLAAETGIAVFRIAFQRWVSEDPGSDLGSLVNDSFDRIRALSAASA